MFFRDFSLGYDTTDSGQFGEAFVPGYNALMTTKTVKAAIDSGKLTAPQFVPRIHDRVAFKAFADHKQP